jgi:uncharacterized membrane protein
MKTEIQLSFADYLDARRLSLRPRKILRALLYVLLALLVLFVAYGVYDTFIAGGTDKTWLWPVGFAVYFSLIYYVLIPWTARRIYKQQKALHDPFTLELAEEELKLVSPRGSACMKYKDFHKWKMNEKAILLYHSDAIYHVIPSRVFPSEAERSAFVEILEKQIGKQKA